MHLPRPAHLAHAVERWFDRFQRPLPWRDHYDPYSVWISEVMAQQTRIDVVVPYYERFLQRFPDIAALASSREPEVLALWSGLGYYRRARFLIAAARDVVARFGGGLPRDVESLRSIPGIGRYTAGAIASIAFDLPAPAVDGNVTRILARVAARDDPWTIASELMSHARSPRKLTQGLMELGALVCTPRKPDCGHCPLRRDCVALATDRIDEFPAKKSAAATREVRLALYVISDSSGRLLLRRESGPLMTGLFHLPHSDATLLDPGTIDVAVGEKLGRFRHTITSRRVEFEVMRARLRKPRPLPHRSAVRDADDDYVWIAPADLASIPHPSYVAKALRIMNSALPRD